MKNKNHTAVAIVLLMVLVCAPAVLADEVSAVWARLYSRASGYEDRIMIMKRLVEIDDTSIVPFLGSSLQALNEARENDMSITEQMQHIELTKMIVRRLGELKAAEYADTIYDVFKTSEDTYLRAESAVALGRTVNPDYSDDMAVFLRNLNLNIGLEGQDKDSEVLALAAVLALERFRQPVGFTPLFFASIGWYSKLSSVRVQATRVLDSLVDDPTEILRDLLTLEGVLQVKLEALEAEARSNAPASGKASIAAEAIRQGLINEPTVATDRSTLSLMRQRGMAVLIEYGPAEPWVIEYLEEILDRNFDINEQLTAVEALKSDGGDEAVLALVRFLKKQNDRQLAGLSPADYRIVRSTIQTLGDIGNSMAFEELATVKISNWPGSIVRDADAALKKLY